MPITRNTPYVEDGVEYPYLAVQMIVNPAITPQMPISAIFNFTPYRILSNQMNEYPPSEMLRQLDGTRPAAVGNLIVSDVGQRIQGDDAMAKALGYIMAGLQSYVTDKNI